MSVRPWFAQPAVAVGTAIVLPGATGGVATPLLHWPAALLTQRGWSVLCVAWDDDRLARDRAATEVVRCASAALDQTPSGQPVLVVAKSLGTLALPWAVEHGLPGAWLTPLLGDPDVGDAVQRAVQPTLVIGGTADPHWGRPAESGPGVVWLEVPGDDHGLQHPGDWRRSLTGQVPVFDRIERLADQVLASVPGAGPL